MNLLKALLISWIVLWVSPGNAFAATAAGATQAMISPDQAVQNRQQERYLQMLEDIRIFQATYHRKYQQLQSQGIVLKEIGYDQQGLEQHIKNAEQGKQEGDMEYALKQLRLAHDVIANAVRTLILQQPQPGRSVPPQVPHLDLAALQAKHENELARLKFFKETFQKKYRQAMDAGKKAVYYDREQLARLEQQAHDLAAKQQYAEASDTLLQARSLVVAALSNMMETHDDMPRPQDRPEKPAEPDQPDITALRARYDHERQRLDFFKQAHAANHRRISQESPSHAIDYDHRRLGELEKQAAVLDTQQKFAEALTVIKQAQGLVIAALRQMMTEQSAELHRLQAEIKAAEEAKPVDTTALRERYEHEKDRLDYFKRAHQRNVKRATEQGETAVDYDRGLLAMLEQQMHQAAEEKHFEEAIHTLKRAQGLVIAALRRMLDDHDFVVKFDISTPELEYKYELNRYLGYDELIPVAISMMQLQGPQKELVLQLAEQGHLMADQAHQHAEHNDYPVAIRMLMDATNQIQKALRTAGVPVLNAK